MGSIHATCTLSPVQTPREEWLKCSFRFEARRSTELLCGPGSTGSRLLRYGATQLSHKDAFPHAEGVLTGAHDVELKGSHVCGERNS